MSAQIFCLPFFAPGTRISNEYTNVYSMFNISIFGSQSTKAFSEKEIERKGVLNINF